MRKQKKSLKAAVIGLLLAGAAALNAFAGTPGWQQENGRWHYYQPDGSLLVSAVTPDGYLVDEKGVWEQKAFSILNQKVMAPERFCGASQMGDWSRIIEPLNGINRQIQSVLPDKRVFHLYTDSLVYCRVSGGKETELLGLYKDTDSDGYRLRLSLDLGKRDLDLSKASTYDYQVFLFFCAAVSADPAVLADAVYCSWQGGNEYGLKNQELTAVGDTLICYEAEDGAGIYSLSARQPEGF